VSRNSPSISLVDAVVRGEGVRGGNMLEGGRAGEGKKEKMGGKRNRHDDLLVCVPQRGSRGEKERKEKN